MRRALAVTAVATALIAAGSPTAAAAPPLQEVITLTCDNGRVYDVVVNGNGAFTPGRAVGSTAVVVPISFSDFTFTAVLPDGTVISENDPGVESKGGGNVAAHSPRRTTTCSFEETEVLEEDDPESGLPAGTVLTFGGKVTVFVSGR